MRVAEHIDRYLSRYPMIAAVLYCALVLVLLFVCWAASADLYDRYQAVVAAGDLLDQLERGGQRSASNSALSASTPQGSPFLEGQTVTVAGAALLQRVAGAVTRFSGNVLSSQVDVQGAQAKAGLVSLVASCEIPQPDLQQLLYDLEAGMPYLFVDQLVVQAPDTVARGEGGRLRVILGVSGQWQGTK
jgi:general secretion pathway protein M